MTDALYWLGDVCEHGQLARVCEICDLKRQLAASNALVDRCRPYVERGYIHDHAGFETAEESQTRSALLADIDGRGK